jgi:hypothetical protein
MGKKNTTKYTKQKALKCRYTIHYNLYQFILINMMILFKGSLWPRSHGNQCQSPSGNSILTRYDAWDTNYINLQGSSLHNK